MMDNRERMADTEEALRTAFDSFAAELWTSLPGEIVSFDPAACTAVIQPTIKGVVTGTDGANGEVNLPLLPDVPVLFPHSKEFALTFPIQSGDECLVWFACRCIDGWWQMGGVQPALDARMHDLSDAFALVGPWSQSKKLQGPPVHAENVQLRSTDGAALIEMAPDKTIHAVNPGAEIMMTPDGEAAIEAAAAISLRAPQIEIAGNLTWTGYTGGDGAYSIAGLLSLLGALQATGAISSDDDVYAQDVSLKTHVNTGVLKGGDDTGPPKR